MSLTKTKQPFLALSKICLNNWHYIDQKILSFNDGINFFTGHSGSGKSTVIDAMQIVLADTMLHAIQNYYMLYLLLGIAITVLIIVIMKVAS